MKEKNPEQTDQEGETILNGGVELTDQNREAIINSTSWKIKAKLLRFHGEKPSEKDIQFANRYQTKEEKAEQRKKEMSERKKAYAFIE